MPRRTRLDQADLRLLGVFSTVADCGGFSAAQVELNVSQSTISSHMADLEAKLGMRLCHRGRAGFRLTEEGKSVYEATQRLFLALESFRSEVDACRGRLSGELHIGTLDSVVTNPRFGLSRAIARFKRREGLVRLTLHVGEPAEIERAVVDGRFHIGLGAYTKRVSGLDYVRLFKERQNLYCGRGHPLFGRTDSGIRLSDLKRFDYIKRPYVPDTRSAHFKHFNPTAFAANMEATALLVLSGRFIGFLPDHYAAQWVGSGAMRAIKPDVVHYATQLELLVRKAKPRQLAVDLFMEDLLAEFQAPGDGPSNA